MASNMRISRALPTTSVVEGLATVLVDCVAGGASVSFMHPLPREKAVAFWQGVLDSAARGERIVLIAEEIGTGEVIGTAQVVLAMPDNQPHRGDLAKMLVSPHARRRGVGEALLRAAESEARSAGKTLLVLDTASADAERLYAKLGWVRCGMIPDYALLPHGGFCDTVLYYRTLGDEMARKDIGGAELPG